MSARQSLIRAATLPFAIVLLSAFAVQAAAPSAVVSPVSPADSLQHLVVQDDLKVELVASEPNVIDPVAIRFDGNGRMWVVEMRDYPMTEITGKDTHSVLKVLDDRDGDGFYETSAVVADNLRYATGVQPWKGGAIVTMSGKVAYFKDTSGDDKADVVETWYTGFSEFNQQLRANHPRFALDNHIYIANGLRGGKIVNARKPGGNPVSISGMDFRFDPITGKCEAVSGSGQFGLTFDDYGNRFICSNRNPAIHVVLEDWELRKNPLVTVPTVVQDVAKAGDQSRVFPIAKSWTTSNLHAGQFTAACGVEVYRGDALGEEFHGNLFICEPTGHLVHREIVKSNGVTFESMPAYDGMEFLASRDPWFSPVNLETGPDGALYVVDMYRAVIEHPEWVPEELKRRPDELYGNDRGRIYRVVPKDFKRPPKPQLAKESSEELVAHLANPNAWCRETAARLLLERQDKSVGKALKEMATKNESPLARISALRLLEGLQLLDARLLQSALEDRDARVLEQAIMVAAPHVSKSIYLYNIVGQLRSHSDARVRFQALLAAAQLPPTPAEGADQWEIDATLIATGDQAGVVLAMMLRDTEALAKNLAAPEVFVAELARLAIRSRDESQRGTAMQALLLADRYQRTGLIAFFDEAARRGDSFETLRERSPFDGQLLDKMLNAARADATDAKKSDSRRCEAIQFVAIDPDTANVIAPIALDDPSQTIRSCAIAALAKTSGTEQWRQLLSQFSSESPALQRAILDGLFVSPERLALLLDAIDAGDVKATELDASRSKQLLNHADAAIKSRAEKVLAAAIPADREKVLAEYQSALALKSDAARGRDIFSKNCATCHRIDDVGTQFAPDISDSREKQPLQLLTDILQPNRAIDSNYFSYTATTVDGHVHTGVLAAETSNSVTLKQAEGKSVTLPRDQIEELHSDGVSFMPDGLEKNIPPQDMADLIAFIKNWRYLKEAPELAR